MKGKVTLFKAEVKRAVSQSFLWLTHYEAMRREFISFEIKDRTPRSIIALQMRIPVIFETARAVWGTFAGQRNHLDNFAKEKEKKIGIAESHEEEAKSHDEVFFTNPTMGEVLSHEKKFFWGEGGENKKFTGGKKVKRYSFCTLLTTKQWVRYTWSRAGR